MKTALGFGQALAWEARTLRIIYRKWPRNGKISNALPFMLDRARDKELGANTTQGRCNSPRRAPQTTIGPISLASNIASLFDPQASQSTGGFLSAAAYTDRGSAFVRCHVHRIHSREESVHSNQLFKALLQGVAVHSTSRSRVFGWRRLLSNLSVQQGLHGVELGMVQPSAAACVMASVIPSFAF